MEIVRNSINVAGLADENNLPERNQEQIIQYSEMDTINIHEEEPEISSIYQVILKAKIHESRNIQTPIGNTVVLDGYKEMKIVYTQKSESGKANFVELQIPINTYVEIPANKKLDTVDIYILDAYFDLLDARRIYSHIIYLLDIKTIEISNQNQLRQQEGNQSQPDKTDNTVIRKESRSLNQKNLVTVDLDEEFL